MFRLVNKYKESVTEPIPEKRIKDLDFFDDVWIKDNNDIYEGWVFDITRRHVIVVYDNAKKDFKFRIEKQTKQTEIKQDDKILYCNKPE